MGQRPTRSLEAIVVEGYRTGALSEAQVRRLRELDTRFEVHALLKEHHVPLCYTDAAVETTSRRIASAASCLTHSARPQ